MKLTYIKNILIAIFILNISDAICTWFAVPVGAAYEINPISNYLLSQGAWTFFGVKVILASTVLIYAYVRIKNNFNTYMKKIEIKICIYVFSIVATAMLIIVSLGFTANFLHILYG